MRSLIVKSLILFLVLFIKTGNILGQSVYSEEKRNELNSLSRTLNQKYLSELDAAKKLWPLDRRYSKELLLDGLTTNGDFLLLRSFNQNAAVTTSTSRISSGGDSGLNLEGEGMEVGVWEVNVPLENHQEFEGRLIIVDTDRSVDTHASHVNGTIMAAGVNPSAKGMAPKATSFSYTAAADDGEMASRAGDGLLISNHSYGFVRGWDDGVWFGDESISTQEDYLFGFYDNEARSWDLIANAAPYYLIIKSAGNERGDSGATNPPDGNSGTGYDCIGHQGISKNVLTVGAVNTNVSGIDQPSDVVMSSFSSWGPADDGRIKPDIVGAGVGIFSASSGSETSYASLQGTSMSAPNVAGSLLLIQELHQKLYGKFLLSSSLKALAIHTAHEAGSNDGPDYSFGWGLLNAYDCTNVLTSLGNDNVTFVEDTLSNGESIEYTIQHDGVGELKATLVWNDPAGTPVGASLDPTDIMLVNDLDLRIVDESDTEYFPWMLNPAAPSVAATKGDNIVDNVEVVQFSGLAAGTYRVRVNHKGTLADDQIFSLFVTSSLADPFDDSFTWNGSVDDSWDDSGNWTTGSGDPKTPAMDDIVVIETAADEVINIQLDSDISIGRLNISGEGQVNFTSSTPRTLTVNADLVIKGQVTFAGVETIVLSGDQDKSILDLGGMNLETSIVLDGTTTWNVFNANSFDNIQLTNGSVNFNDEELSFNTVEVDATWDNLDFFAGKQLSIEESLVSNVVLDLTGTSISFIENLNAKILDVAGASLDVLTTENGKLDVQGAASISTLNASSGELAFSANTGVGTLALTNITELSLADGIEVEVSVLSVSGEGVTRISSPTGATISSSEERRICLDDLEIENVTASGTTELVGGASSSYTNATGWIQLDCDDHLFADFTVFSTCVNSATQFTDISSGTPVEWLWEFATLGTSTEQNPVFEFPQIGEFSVKLTVTDENSNEVEYLTTIDISESSLSKPTFELVGNILRAQTAADVYEWYKDDALISTSSFVTLSGGGTYVLRVIADNCFFDSEPLLVLSADDDGVLEMYPNPFSHELNVRLASEVRQTEISLSILDLQGKSIYERVFDRGENSATINTEALPNGIYILRLEFGTNQIINGRVIKK